MAQILIIDDDQQIGTTIGSLLERLGHSYDLAGSKSEGLAKVQSLAYDLIFLDVFLPDGNGMDMIKDLKSVELPAEIIILTGMGDVVGAEIALQNDVWDYIEKGSSFKEIILSCKRALQYRQERLQHSRPVALRLDSLVGQSPEMKRCYDLVAQAASSLTNVLVSGETGTGKELIARAIHQNSGRSAENFVVVDCAALPSSMIESILFGHEKGAFTGAHHSRKGLIAQAAGGTLFLDEIGELPLELQRVFLRVLQEHRYRPLGSSVECKSSFRLVAATNRDLNELVAAGKFRQDLFFRLNTLEIELPPLRRRSEDIRSIALFHQKRIALRYGGREKVFSSGLFEVLEAYSWPGNVRELVNAVEFAYSKAGPGATLFSQHLPPDIRLSRVSRQLAEKKTRAQAEIATPPVNEELPSLKEYRWRMDEIYFNKLMALTSGEVKKAIAISGLSRSAFYALQKRCQESPSRTTSPHNHLD